MAAGDAEDRRRSFEHRIIGDQARGMSELYSEVGELKGELRGFADLLRQHVIPKLDRFAELPGQITSHMDEDRRFHADHEKRVRALETSDNKEAGGSAATAKWAAGISATLSILINGVVMALTWRQH